MSMQDSYSKIFDSKQYIMFVFAHPDYVVAD